MNIPDEYFTDEQPQQCGAYIMRIDNGEYRSDSLIDVTGITRDPDNVNTLVIAGGMSLTTRPFDRVRFCRVAPAAELDKLKAENERLRGWVEDAYDEGYIDGDSTRVTGQWACSTAKARLEGRTE